jgi:Rod binding domain-containing protein
MSEVNVNLARLLPAADSAIPNAKVDDPAKIRDAAQQFEALLLSQILRTVRESGGGWLGSGGDPSSDCATEFAEQHFASLLARQGGLGLATLIAKGLGPRET